MNIFHALGLAWVVFTSALATTGILYLAFVGLKTIVLYKKDALRELPVEVKEMFKVAR